MNRCLLFAALAAAFGAFGSGLNFTENGTKALVQGGAFTAQADDVTAAAHNPAGLTRLSGLHVLLDSQLLNQETRFLRKDQGSATTLANEVSNQGGLFYLPFLGATYGLTLADRPLTLGLSAYGPPSTGVSKYPTPSYARDPNDPTRYVETPRRFAPQRYALIYSNVIILYPGLSVAYEPTPWLSLGATAQYVFSDLYFTQSIYSGPTPARQANEDPEFDSQVVVDLKGRGGFTGVVGALARPTDKWAVGVSLRPPHTVSSRGTFRIELGEFATRLGAEMLCADARQDGPATECPNGADFSINLPLELRLGARFEPTRALGFNADLQYSGWSSVKQMVLTPRNLSLKLGGAEPKPVEAFAIEKNWKDTFTARAGGSYRFDFGLSAYAGAWFEQAAAPDEYTNIDFLLFERVVLTGGVGYERGPVEVLVGGTWTPTITKEITTSAVKAGTDGSFPGGVVGNGTYTSGGWLVTLGLRLKLFQPAEAQKGAPEHEDI